MKKKMNIKAIAIVALLAIGGVSFAIVNSNNESKQKVEQTAEGKKTGCCKSKAADNGEAKSGCCKSKAAANGEKKTGCCKSNATSANAEKKSGCCKSKAKTTASTQKAGGCCGSK